jgi:neutral amino acid transport system substrate-binding protein
MAFGVRDIAGLGVLALAGVASSMLACKVDHGGGSGTQNPSGQPITIGASIGITGGLSGNTRALKGGIAVAQNQINSAGGVLGRPITFVIEDDQSDPTTAPGVYTSLQQDGAEAVLGPGASSEVTADLPELGYTGCMGDGGCSPPPLSSANNDVLIVSATATSILLTENQTNSDGWFFRTVPNDSYQGRAVVQFALQGPGEAGVGCTNMAVVYQTDQYGGPMDAIIEPAFKAAGGHIVVSIGIPATTQSSYMTEVAEIVSASPTPDCMAMVVFAPTGAQFVTNLRTAQQANPSLWTNFFIVGTDGCYATTFISDATPSPGQPSTVRGVFGTNAQTAPPTMQYGDLQALYDSQIGLAQGQTDLDPYTSSIYDAAILVALALEQAGTAGNLTPSGVRTSMFSVSNGGGQASAMPFNPSQVPQALQALQQGEPINYNGASGNVDFTPSGDVVADFIVWEVVPGSNGDQFTTFREIPATSITP